MQAGKNDYMLLYNVINCTKHRLMKPSHIMLKQLQSFSVRNFSVLLRDGVTASRRRICVPSSTASDDRTPRRA